MNRFLLLFFFHLFFTGYISAQEVIDTFKLAGIDSAQNRDTLPGVDTTLKFAAPDSAIKYPLADTVVQQKYSGEKFRDRKRAFREKDGLFYLLTALLLLFAFFNRLFPKYFSDLFRLFFRTTLNQSQIKEQMIQSPLPSLLLNLYFVITGGLYLDFIFRHYRLGPPDKFWLVFLCCSLGLAAIYSLKFFGLKISGWLFNLKIAADSYIFIVFVINKMAGIFLLPVLILLSFTSGDVFRITITLSYCGIGAFLIYRFILTYSIVRKQISINPFQFLLYILAFEIIPLLVLYKVLLAILKRTA